MSSLHTIAQLHQGVIFLSPSDQGRRVTKKHLVNVLNYINFQNGTITLNFEHVKYGNTVAVSVCPQPCADGVVNCLWTEPPEFLQKLNSYRFLNFVVNRDLKVLLVEAAVRHIDEKGVGLLIPDYSFEMTLRRVNRYRSSAVEAEMVQNGLALNGRLIDFSSLSLCIEVSVAPPQTFRWVNNESTVFLMLKNAGELIYSCECRMVRSTSGKKSRSFVLEPVTDKVERFFARQYRSESHTLSPPPNMVFRHPLMNKMVSLEVGEISCSELCVEEYYEYSVLFPGLIIPEISIEIANDFTIQCKAQVLSRTTDAGDEGKRCVRHVIAILDMAARDQVRLAALLHRVGNRKAYVCNIVDMDDLWKFFFDAGFVYPDKYLSMHLNKEDFKETYEKLWYRSPSIARHFIYQDKGIIKGHLSMIRFYENSWLIHHHASTGHNLAGLVVLDQAGRFINDYRSLYSTHMDYVMCYYRPDNRFPERVFGGFARKLGDAKGCSQDPLCYLHFDFQPQGVGTETEGWDLLPVVAEDFVELRNFYEYESGGLMLNALDLDTDMSEGNGLDEEFRAHGFRRERHVFSLKKDGDLKAVIVATISDAGLNFSNLTNCIHVLVTDPEDLPGEILFGKVAEITFYKGQTDVPLLVFPVRYVIGQMIRFEKIYNLWVINSQFGDIYLEHTEALFHHL